MYAVVVTGGKQYRVEPGTVLEVEKLEAEPGTTVELNPVILCSDDTGVAIGSPTLTDVKVVARVRAHARGPKLLIFRYKRRKRCRRKLGHRQPLTQLEIVSVSRAA